MIFEPTTHDLELIASLSIARAPVARIAAAVNLSEAEFSAWCARLALGRAWHEPVAIPPKRERRVPERLKVRAERYFESVSEPPQADGAAIQEAVEFYST